MNRTITYVKMFIIVSMCSTMILKADIPEDVKNRLSQMKKAAQEKADQVYQEGKKLGIKAGEKVGDLVEQATHSKARAKAQGIANQVLTEVQQTKQFTQAMKNPDNELVWAAVIASSELYLQKACSSDYLEDIYHNHNLSNSLNIRGYARQIILEALEKAREEARTTQKNK